MLDHGSPKQVYNLNFTRNALLIQTMQNWKLEIYGLLSSGQEGVKELGVYLNFRWGAKELPGVSQPHERNAHDIGFPTLMTFTNH